MADQLGIPSSSSVVISWNIKSEGSKNNQSFKTTARLALRELLSAWEHPNWEVGAKMAAHVQICMQAKPTQIIMAAYWLAASTHYMYLFWALLQNLKPPSSHTIHTFWNPRILEASILSYNSRMYANYHVCELNVAWFLGQNCCHVPVMHMLKIGLLSSTCCPSGFVRRSISHAKVRGIQTSQVHEFKVHYWSHNLWCTSTRVTCSRSLGHTPTNCLCVGRTRIITPHIQTVCAKHPIVTPLYICVLLAILGRTGLI